MEFFKVLEKRHCCRDFNPNKSVNNNLIEKIIKAGKMAPSAGGIYPVEFAVISDQSLKEKLTDTTTHVIRRMDFIAQAPFAVVIYADVQKTAARYSNRGRDLYVIQDAAAAAENIFLSVTALGLDTCWVGAFDESEVRKVLKLKTNERPMVIMPIGYKKNW